MEHHLISATLAASLVGEALAEGRVDKADRTMTEAISRLILSSGEFPAEVLEEPFTTGDRKYDQLLCTGFAYALIKHGLEPMTWMTAQPPLTKEWLWDDSDGYASIEYRSFIRRNTPELFLSKGILLRERDLIAP